MTNAIKLNTPDFTREQLRDTVRDRLHDAGDNMVHKCLFEDDFSVNKGDFDKGAEAVFQAMSSAFTSEAVHQSLLQETIKELKHWKTEEPK